MDRPGESPRRLNRMATPSSAQNRGLRASAPCWTSAEQASKSPDLRRSHLPPGKVLEVTFSLHNRMPVIP